MILKTSSVIMTVIEYSVFRGKVYNVFHWSGVVFIIGSLCMIMLFVSDSSGAMSWNTTTILGFVMFFVLFYRFFTRLGFMIYVYLAKKSC